ncbi:MAG TPA: phosphate ABC transporter permease, partial [Woeseiaceae bacterium]|nr:phosphate ABC transporter permease [Woeseiaceae bacterium]
MTSASPRTTSAVPSLAATDARRRVRAAKDIAARAVVTLGGIAVIAAIALIFFYLLEVVLPLFKPASMAAGDAFPVPGPADRTLHLSLEERAETGARYTSAAEVIFFRAQGGEVVDRVRLAAAPATATSLGVSDIAGDGVVIGLNDGRIVATRVKYEISYPGNTRRVTPGVVYPLGRDPIVVDQRGRAVVAVSGRVGDRDARFVSVVADGTVVATHVGLETSFLTGETTIAETSNRELPVRIGTDELPAFVLLDPTQEWLYLATRSGDAAVLRRRGAEFVLNERLRLADTGERLTDLEFLTGGISLLAGTDRGRILQWFPVRSSDNSYRLRQIRVFDDDDSPVSAIASEHRRKGFVAAHADGTLGVHYTTSERTLIERRVSDAPVRRIAFSPRADRIVAATTDGRLRQWSVDNRHPEISWSALWGRVWYESYPKPEYVWQSSSAANAFEPKLSLLPLSFGTIKAAFYAMLIAMPLAILGAVFTGYFMRAGMRRIVKPTVEIMEALPTVILGFLAGLWLAPLLEANLTAVFLLLLLLPAGTVLTGFLWHRLPSGIRGAVPPGWEPALLVPPMIVLGWLAFTLGPPIENALFGGNLPQWLSDRLGI